MLNSKEVEGKVFDVFHIRHRRLFISITEKARKNVGRMNRVRKKFGTKYGL